MLRRLALVVWGLCLASALFVAVASGSAPNGIESKSPDAIVAAALAAGSGARSVWVHGGGVDNGEKLALDIHVGTRGGRGHLLAGGLSFDFIRVASTVYFRGDVVFWRKAAGPSYASLAPLLAGKWMKVSARKSVLGPFVAFTDLPVLLRGLLTNHGTLANGGLTTFAGQSVVAVRDTTQGGTLYVAATGEPYPEGVVNNSGTSKGTIRFDQWNQALTVKAPKHAVDLSRYIKK